MEGGINDAKLQQNLASSGKFSEPLSPSFPVLSLGM